MNKPAPQITINGKKYSMPKPKIKLWRHMIRFTEAQQNGELEGGKMLDEMLDLVVIAFGCPEITRETVEENVDFEELTNLISYISRQVTGIANAKAAEIPNGMAPART